MIVLNSPAGIIVFLSGLLSMAGMAVAVVMISLHRKKHESTENE